MESRLNFDKLKKNIEILKRELPVRLANTAQNYFLQSFQKQGWEGKKWEEVQRRISGTNAYKYPKKKDLGRRRRPILIGKGSTQLRRAVANSARTGVTQWPIVRMIVGLPYAKRHNEGLKGMPKRKFFGDSKELRKKHKQTIILLMKDLKRM